MNLTSDKVLKLIGKKRSSLVDGIYFDGSNPEVITVELVYPYVNESTIYVWEVEDTDTQKDYIDSLKFWIDTAKQDKDNHCWRNYK